MLGERKITSSNAKWLEKLGQMDDTLKEMVRPDDDENWGSTKVKLFGGGGAEESDSDGY